jgi:hypothetical protein
MPSRVAQPYQGELALPLMLLSILALFYGVQGHGWACKMAVILWYLAAVSGGAVILHKIVRSWWWAWGGSFLFFVAINLSMLSQPYFAVGPSITVMYGLVAAFSND